MCPSSSLLLSCPSSVSISQATGGVSRNRIPANATRWSSVKCATARITGNTPDGSGSSKGCGSVNTNASVATSLPVGRRSSVTRLCRSVRSPTALSLARESPRYSADTGKLITCEMDQQYVWDKFTLSANVGKTNSPGQTFGTKRRFVNRTRDPGRWGNLSSHISMKVAKTKHANPASNQRSPAKVGKRRPRGHIRQLAERGLSSPQQRSAKRGSQETPEIWTIGRLLRPGKVALLLPPLLSMVPVPRMYPTAANPLSKPGHYRKKIPY